MKNFQQEKRNKFKKRARRTRARLHGTSAIPRAAVHRSLSHISVQLIDDEEGKTLCAASDYELKTAKKSNKYELARAVGSLAAEKAKKATILRIVFDRRGYRYHGRIKALAEGMREKGLVF